MLFIDKTGFEIEILKPPVRIISLVPSLTELLFDLGLNDRIVGITKFCVHPEFALRSKVKVGGTKEFDFEAIKNLNPDLIIGNKEENYKEGIEELRKHYPVYVTDINTLDEAIESIREIGKMTDSNVKSEELIDKITYAFNQFKPAKIGLTVAYFIWRKPYMVAGGNTFINEILKICGFFNVFEDRPRYPQVQSEELNKKSPDLILLSSEPYPFSDKHIAEFRQLSPTANVKLVDGEIYSWYGSRLLKAPDYFKHFESQLLKEKLIPPK